MTSQSNFAVTMSPGNKKSAANAMPIVCERKIVSGYTVLPVEVLGGTSLSVKKLWVKASAFLPAAESMAGLLRSEERRLPPAWNSHESQRKAPVCCQS